jgi:hypothetical protein
MLPLRTIVIIWNIVTVISFESVGMAVHAAGTLIWKAAETLI